MEVCESCVFYVPKTAGNLGRCHRYPPQVHLNRSIRWVEFPEVIGNIEWCGEHQQPEFQGGIRVREADEVKTFG